MSSSYHFVKWSHGYELLEKVNQPLSLQHNSMAMLYYHSEIVIKIQQRRQFFYVVYMANLSRDSQEVIKIHVIGFLCY